MGKTTEYIGESAGQASYVTSAVADAVQEGAGVVRRAAKRGSDAAEEFLSDATERMQHHLVVTVATHLRVGFTAGALIGWTMRQK